MSNQSRISLEQIKSNLDFDNLLGWEAQKGMAPPSRLPMDKYTFDRNKVRVAAVVILMYEDENQVKFPLILRNVYKGVHSNQIGLPGGKVETFDLNLEETAKRECQEEIGADRSQIEILGPLSEMYIPPSNFLVQPYVGLYKGRPDFVPCDIEVQKIIHVELEAFVDYNKHAYVMVDSEGIEREVPVYHLENGLKLWGATAMMLNEFKIFVRKSLNL